MVAANSLTANTPTVPPAPAVTTWKAYTITEIDRGRSKALVQLQPHWTAKEPTLSIVVPLTAMANYAGFKRFLALKGVHYADPRQESGRARDNKIEWLDDLAGAIAAAEAKGRCGMSTTPPDRQVDATLGIIENVQAVLTDLAELVTARGTGIHSQLLARLQVTADRAGNRLNDHLLAMRDCVYFGHEHVVKHEQERRNRRLMRA